MSAKPRLGPSALLLALTLPFTGRAFNIDEPLYLGAARHLLAHPFDPLGAPSAWHGAATTYFHDSYNPPLTAYLLAPAIAIAGGRAWPLRLLAIGVALLTLRSLTRVGQQLGVPGRAFLLLAASPLFALCSVSVMADMPSLWLSALAWQAALAARPASAGAWAGLSSLAKYSSLLNFPICWLAQRSGRARALTVAIGAGIFGLWCLSNLAGPGSLHVVAAARFARFEPRRLFQIAGAFVAGVGLAGLPAALLLLRWDRALVAATALGAIWGGLAPVQPLVSGIAFASGSALLLAALRASWRHRHGFLLGALWLQALYAVGFVHFGAARYALPLLAPMLFLLALGGEIDLRAGARWWTAIGTGVVLALGLSWADAGYADAWRRAAERLPSAARGFGTGAWGFQWYATDRGYRPLEPRLDLRAGDLLAEPEGIHVSRPPPALAALLEAQGSIDVASPWLRVMDRSASAGLYSSDWGLLPFGLRRGARERVALSSPARWLLARLDAPAPGPVSLDIGTPEARHVLLDGWSGDESFAQADGTRTFAWMEGPEAALRVRIPKAVRRICLVAYPGREALGPLDIAVGSEARARVVLREGWRSYEADVEGTVGGGLTTVVLRPAGYRTPGRFDSEPRALSVAVDAIGFDRDAAGNHGTWAARHEGRPMLLVAGDPAPSGSWGAECRTHALSADASLVDCAE